MQREGGWARIAWAGGKLSTMETTGHVVRVKKLLNAEPGLNDVLPGRRSAPELCRLGFLQRDGVREVMTLSAPPH